MGWNRAYLHGGLSGSQKWCNLTKSGDCIMAKSYCFWGETSNHLLPRDARAVESFLRNEFHSIPFRVELRREVNAVEVTPLTDRLSWITIEGRLSRIGYNRRPGWQLPALLYQMVKECLSENICFHIFTRRSR